MAQRNALGRGLDALFSMDEVKTEGSSSINEIELSKITVNPNQPRHEFDPVALQELADSISEIGIIQPITLRKLSDDEYQIIAGERRFRASQLAGLTSARHDVVSKYLAEKYPESYDKAVPEELVYSGNLKLTDKVEDSPLDAGKLVLSPTRTYAPVVKKLLDALRPEIHGMVHCSGGAQTKILHFVDKVRVVKDNLFPVPPLFKTIKEQSGTDWEEMYKVFNMGHRLEVYLSPEHAEEVIAISKSFNIDAQIVGRVEESDKKELIIRSEFGEFKY